jgi:hypothetical protein
MQCLWAFLKYAGLTTSQSSGKPYKDIISTQVCSTHTQNPIGILVPFPNTCQFEYPTYLSSLNENLAASLGAVTSKSLHSPAYADRICYISHLLLLSSSSWKHTIIKFWTGDYRCSCNNNSSILLHYGLEHASAAVNCSFIKTCIGSIVALTRMTTEEDVQLITLVFGWLLTLATLYKLAKTYPRQSYKITMWFDETRYYERFEIKVQAVEDATIELSSIISYF